MDVCVFACVYLHVQAEQIFFSSTVSCTPGSQVYKSCFLYSAEWLFTVNGDDEGLNHF